MSQSFANKNENGEHRDSSEELSSGVTLENILQTMTQNFKKIQESLDLLVHGQAMILSTVMFLANNVQPAQEDTSEDMDQSERQLPVETVMPATPPPTPSASPKKTDEVDLEATGCSPTIKCADCGEEFVRKKSFESITHHAKTTSCRPFQCSECKQLYKTVSAFTL